MTKSSKPLGCACLWCGVYVKQEQMQHHVWAHGVASIGHCNVSSPPPWSRRQGYWDALPAYEPLAQQQAAVLDVPLQPTLLAEE